MNPELLFLSSWSCLVNVPPCPLLSSCHVWWYNIFHLVPCSAVLSAVVKAGDMALQLQVAHLEWIFCVLLPCHLIRSLSPFRWFWSCWRNPVYRNVAFLHISYKIFSLFRYDNRTVADNGDRIILCFKLFFLFCSIVNCFVYNCVHGHHRIVLDHVVELRKLYLFLPFYIWQLACCAVWLVLDLIN